MTLAACSTFSSGTPSTPPPQRQPSTRWTSGAVPCLARTREPGVQGWCVPVVLRHAAGGVGDVGRLLDRRRGHARRAEARAVAARADVGLRGDLPDEALALDMRALGYRSCLVAASVPE